LSVSAGKASITRTAMVNGSAMSLLIILRCLKFFYESLGTIGLLFVPSGYDFIN
jgi:hypothetical protein